MFTCDESVTESSLLFVSPNGGATLAAAARWYNYKLQWPHYFTLKVKTYL